MRNLIDQFNQLSDNMAKSNENLTAMRQNGGFIILLLGVIAVCLIVKSLRKE